MHFREPGLEHKEDLRTGTRGAALGGITSIFEMPNTKPNTDTAERIAEKVQRGREKAFVDFAFFVGATAENASELSVLEQVEGCSGVKVFMGSSTGNASWSTKVQFLREILRNGTRRIAVHCEDEARLRARRNMVDAADANVQMHPQWRDEEVAFQATERLIRLARNIGRRVHVLHVSTEKEALFLEQHKDIATMEVTPQHLLLQRAGCIRSIGNLRSK